MNKDWCMNFTNREIIKYLVNRLDLDIRYLVNDEYVEADCYEDFEFITFDGEEQDFFIMFLKCQTSIIKDDYEIMFIDDNEKTYYTTSDVYDNVVYEGKLNHLTHVQILDLLYSFISILKNCRIINVYKKKAEISDVKYSQYNYIINLKNEKKIKECYVFENIVLRINN